MFKYIFTIFFFIFCINFTCKAKEEPSVVISDDEIESALEDWLQELFDVAAIKLKPDVIILQNSQVNAGATYGGQIVVFTGLIQKCKNIGQLMGVLAHETGHIAASHVANAESNIQSSALPAFATLLLGGAATLLTGNPGGLVAGLAGGAHVLERSLLKRSREQEESADASAIQYLTKKGWPVSGLSDFLGLISNHYSGHEDPYVQTHPLSHERQQKVKLYQKEKQTNASFPKDYEDRFNRIKAKVNGFLKTRSEVFKEYPLTLKTIEARYARLIASYRFDKSSNGYQKALSELDALLTEKPNDPYFLELKGQISFENGRIEEALNSFKKAMQIKPKSLGLKLIYAHALIEASLQNNDKGNLKKAIQYLNEVVDRRPEALLAWKFLASAYGRLGEEGNALACLAQESFLNNNKLLAKKQAERGKNATNPILKTKALDLLSQIGQEKE